MCNLLTVNQLVIFLTFETTLSEFTQNDGWGDSSGTPKAQPSPGTIFPYQQSQRSKDQG